MKRFKKLLMIALVICFGSIQAFSQNEQGYTMLSIGGGQGLSSNSKFFTLNLDKTSTKRLNFGVAAQVLFYSADRGFSPYWQAENRFYFGGLYAKYTLGVSRNFSYDFQAGGYAGSDGKKFMYYPDGGFNEYFWIAPQTQFFISQKLGYLFSVNEQDNVKQRWMPHFNLGIRFNL